MTNENKIEDRLPLTEPMLAILVALSGRELHGYELRKQINEETKYDIPTGTLYRNLAKMLEAGYIEEVAPPANADERRRYYTTTGLGERIADAEIERMLRYVKSRRPEFVLGLPQLASRWGL